MALSIADDIEIEYDAIKAYRATFTAALDALAVIAHMMVLLVFQGAQQKAEALTLHGHSFKNIPATLKEGLDKFIADLKTEEPAPKKPKKNKAA